MTRNSIVWSISVRVVLVCGMLSCSGDNGGDTPVGGSSDEAGSGASPGETNGDPYVNPPDECPIKNPPFDDPFCFNTGCPLADLATVTGDNKSMGDCCNTVDVKLREESMEKGQRYDLEFAWLSNSPQSNPNLANPGMSSLLLNYQLAGADVILMRFRNVPRTADMDGPETVKLDLFAGKLNCDGTWSFYGPNAAPEPVHEGPPNDPSRWVKKTLEVQYNGFEKGKDLATIPPPEVVASTTKLTWSPRWKPESIDYELPVKFMVPRLIVGDNWSCFGSIDQAGKWKMTAELITFIPVEEAKTTKVQDLMNQTICGLFAYEPGSASCDDGPQSEWPVPPTGYCDAEHKCWIGDPTDPEYADFWSEWYEDEDGCGGTYPCCDPAGADSTLEPCNAWYLRVIGTVAAVDITDDEIDDPSQVFSHRANCES